MGLKIKLGIFYTVYILRYSWYRLFYDDKAVEIFVERCSHPRIALKIIGVKVGKYCRIHNGLTLYNFKKQHLQIGDNVHIGKSVFLDLTDKISIHNNCTISMGSKILTHMDVGDSDLKVNYPKKTGAITLEENVYIGAQSLVLYTAEVIKSRTLLASNSTLVKRTKPSSMYAGNPAIFKSTI